MSPADWFQNKLADATPERRLGLEELVDLKQSELLSSREAFLHLRHTAAVEALIAAGERDFGGPSGLSIPLVKNLCQRVEEAAANYLELFNARLSTTRNWGILPSHAVLPFFEGMHEQDHPADYLWRLDYRQFLRDYLNVRGLLAEEAAGEAAPELLFRAAFLTAVGGDYPYLTNARSGEQISFQDFKRDPRHRSFEPSDPARVRDCLAVLRRAMEVPRRISDAEYHRQERDRDLRHFAGLLNENLQAPFDYSPLSDARELHDFNALYERAERERTLRHLPVERRLARAAVFECSDEKLPGAERVEQALGLIRRRLAGSQERHQRLAAAGMPPVVIQRELKMAERCTYQIWAIQQNRRSLAEYFDH